jgi:hypothetical protein
VPEKVYKVVGLFAVECTVEWCNQVRGNEMGCFGVSLFDFIGLTREVRNELNVQQKELHSPIKIQSLNVTLKFNM